MMSARAPKPAAKTAPTASKKSKPAVNAAALSQPVGLSPVGLSVVEPLEAAALEVSVATVLSHGEQFFDERGAGVTAATRALEQLLQQKPESLVPLIDKFTQGILGQNRRIAQLAAEALPVLTRLAPARVARQLDRLKASFAQASQAGQDGLVRTFAALCVASVAYQKRLEPVLTYALQHADGKLLQRWTETILPALKGEPHARARAVVEQRLYDIPRPLAQKLAEFLGIKLRPKIH